MQLFRFVYIPCLISTLAVIFIGVLFSNSHRPIVYNYNVSTLSECSRAHPGNALGSCIAEKVPAILKSESFGDLMAFISASTTSKEITSICHPIMHEIGKELYDRVGTIEGALSQCSELCKYGCIHGVIGEAVRNQLGKIYSDEDVAHAPFKALEEMGLRYCNQNESFCHAMGHLFYINSSNYVQSLSACNNITKDIIEQDRCYQGVFMQAAGGAESLATVSNTPTITTSIEQGLTMCQKFYAKYQHACFLYLFAYQIRFFESKNIKNEQLIARMSIDLCNQLSGIARHYCFYSLGYRFNVIIGQKTVIPICGLVFDPKDYAACIAGEAIRISGDTTLQD